jgi:hypothetical protein
MAGDTELIRKIVSLAVDTSLKYQRYLLGMITSFRKHNVASDYTVRVYGVGIGKDFTDRLTAMGCEVRVSPRTNPIKGQSYFPCAVAKCLALASVEGNDLIITMDADGLMLSSMDSLVRDFLASGADVALLPETDKRGNAGGLVRDCWFGCPSEPFKNLDSWSGKPILNCGMVISHGEPSRRIGAKALQIALKYEQSLYLGEQGPINGVVYDGGYRVFSLSPSHHCVFTTEDHLTFNGVPYLGPPPYDTPGVLIDGNPVIYRHFGNRYVKNYQVALDYLLLPGD